jgi:NADPH-dependent curcumin reductase CurA
MERVNKQVRLAARARGLPKESDFEIAEAPVPEPGEGKVLVRIVYLSVDPYMRGRMREGSSYAKGVEIGEVMVGGAVGQVEQSHHPEFRPGDYVEGNLGWQTYALSDGKDLRKLDPKLAPLSTALGVLGMPGLTAYFGVTEICKPKAGETMVVSGAAGAVGSVAGQIGKVLGCRVVGTAGSDEKVQWITSGLGFDGGFNYKTAGDYRAELAGLCPQGIDVYFDNVGGSITDAVLTQINTRARIALCGQISQYNLEKPERGPRLLFQLVIRQAKMEGFLVFQFADRYREGLEQLAAWVKEGKLKYREQFEEGIERAPHAFISMLQGGNIGKQLVRVSHE